MAGEVTGGLGADQHHDHQDHAQPRPVAAAVVLALAAHRAAPAP